MITQVAVSAWNTLPTGEIKKLSPLLYTFLPTVLLVSVTALMPALVGRSELLVRHWTRSGLNRAIMKKTLMLLLVMVLILPSLGLTSANAFFEWTLSGENSTARWECVFLPDQVCPCLCGTLSLLYHWIIIDDTMCNFVGAVELQYCLEVLSQLTDFCIKCV